MPSTLRARSPLRRPAGPLTVAERLPGGPPPGIHDPALFVDRARLLAAADALGLELRLVGLRPSFRDALAWRLGRRATVRMKPVRSTAAVFAGYGRLREGRRRGGGAQRAPVRSGT